MKNKKFSSIESIIKDAKKGEMYILVDDEYKNMRRSKPEKQEELFLSYWKERDPSPETKENELQDEYFSRVAYANSSFKGSTDGWRTHMGEIYIKFGRPDDIGPAGTKITGRCPKASAPITRPGTILSHTPRQRAAS